MTAEAMLATRCGGLGSVAAVCSVEVVAIRESRIAPIRPTKHERGRPCSRSRKFDPEIFRSLDKSAGCIPELAESQRTGVRYEL